MNQLVSECDHHILVLMLRMQEALTLCPICLCGMHIDSLMCAYLVICEVSLSSIFEELLREWEYFT
jgi:hypothetical protein